jgi:hypothetical protein
LEHVVQGVEGEKNKQLESWCFYKRKKNTQEYTKILGGRTISCAFIFAFFGEEEPNACKKQGMSMLVNNKLQAK